MLSPRDRRQTTGTLLAAAAACLLLCGCQSGIPKTPMAAPATPVKLLTLRTMQVSQTSSYLGTMRSRKSIMMHPQVEGQVLEIFVRSGDAVKQNAPLMRIDAAKQAASVDSFAAAAESSRSDYAEAQEKLKALDANRLSKLANLKFQQQQLDRYQSLREQGAVSQENVDLYVNLTAQAKADLQNVESQMSAQEALIKRGEREMARTVASMKMQQVELRYHTLRAPFEGVIGDVPVRLGEFVTNQTELLTVNQNEPIELYVQVPAEKAAALKIGMPVELTDGSTGKPEIGQIRFISPQVALDTNTILVKASFANTDKRLRTGQEVTARLIWSRSPGLLVPTVAVSRLSGQDFVFIARTNKEGALVARQIPIEVGDIDGDSFQVRTGLKAGDQVIVSGTLNLVDGAPVAAKEEAQAQTGSRAQTTSPAQKQPQS